MDSIGAEVGQKMRSAIKAKLMELDCYVDDELPDYIMVMVANKRTKSQMNEDLNLFLAAKTAAFVNWLHIVLKKLKEVTVTNPEVYKKATKRKPSAEDLPDVKVKKEKREKKVKKEEEKRKNLSLEKSLTDDLPITANKLAEQRKIILLTESSKSTEQVTDDNFDIPLLSEVNASNEEELEDIERKIRSVKSRLGLLVESENEEEVCINLKTETDELFSKPNEELQETETEESNALADSRKIRILEEEEQQSNENINIAEKNIEKSTESEKSEDEQTSFTPEKRKEHQRIVFSADGNSTPHRKLSILERLGKRPGEVEIEKDIVPSRKKISLSEYRKEEEKFLGYSRHTNRTDRDRTPERKDRLRDRDSRYLHSRRREKSRSRERRTSSNDRRRDRSRERYNRKDAKKEGILSRLGVLSKVSVPSTKHDVSHKPPEPEEEGEKDVIREVPSLIKVKPRVIPPDSQQPNKNLLLKAVAEAQRSIAQAPKVGKPLKPDALYTRKFKDKNLEEKSHQKNRISTQLKEKLRNLITQTTKTDIRHDSYSESDRDDDYDSDGKYIPKPIKKTPLEVPKYVPSAKVSEDNSEDEEVKQQFVITLDGIETTKYAKKRSAKERLDGRKTPSPIIFNKETITTTIVKPKPNIPDKLPVVHAPLSVKIKERCKYWPTCRQGDKCEFVHPTSNCENFPHCKFGEKCLYLHPNCKFGSSCTKRDCPYAHAVATKPIPVSRTSVKIISSPLQNCKYYPNCSNPSCPFYHPKPCKFGKYCKNQSECTFAHSFVMTKRSLSWRSK